MKNIIILLLTFVSINTYCFGYTQEEEEFLSRVKISTCYDIILWFGQDYPDFFDPTNLSKEECKIALKKGLEVCDQKAKNGDVISQGLLAQYYFTSIKNTNYPKALYWAHEAAKQGCSESMLILHNSYISGTGVVMDLEEGLKWCFLAAAKGNKEMKEKANKITNDSFHVEKIKPIIDESRSRANLWMNQHKELFFSS